MNYIGEMLIDKEFDILLNLERWNGHRVEKEENVATHSFFVALFARLFAEAIFGAKESQLKKEVMEWGLTHDYRETFDYDINHSVKYNEGNGEQIRKLLDDFTDREMQKKYIEKNVFFDEEYPVLINNFLYNASKKELYSDLVVDIVKIADWYSCLYYLVREKRMGNVGLEKEYVHTFKGFTQKCKEFLETYEKLGEEKGYDFTVLKAAASLDYQTFDFIGNYYEHTAFLYRKSLALEVWVA